jgi:hypothetical protein
MLKQKYLKKNVNVVESLPQTNLNTNINRN